MKLGLAGRAAERVSALLAFVAMAGVLAMMAIVVVDVALRTFAATSLLLAEEVCGYLLVLVATLAYAEALKRDRHVRVDLLFRLVSPRLRARLELLHYVLAFAALSVVLYATTVMTYRSYERGVTVPGVLLTPIYLPQIVMVVGLAALLLQLLVEIRKLIGRPGE